MGKTVTGGATHEKNIELLTKDQKKYLSNVLGSNTSKANRSIKDLLSAPDEAEGFSWSKFKDFMSPAKNTYKDLMNVGTSKKDFNYGVVQPMMQQYEQNVLPAIQQRYADLNAGSSSALNQALAQSANDLTTQLAAQYLPYQQSQQQTQLSAAQGYSNLANPYLTYMGQSQNAYQNAQANRLAALSNLTGLGTSSTQTPLISENSGILGSLIGAGGQMGAASLLASSREIKENIRSYQKGIEEIRKLEVKRYDYKPEAGGEKGKVGLIAEDVPEEIRGKLNGVNAVDLYGLVGLLVNAVKQLDDRLESHICHNR